MDDADILDSMLREFDRDPIAALARRPVKLDDQGRPAPEHSAFSQRQIDSGQYVAARDEVRKEIRTVRDGVLVSLRDVLPGRAPYEDNDRPENLVDRLTLTRPHDMESLRQSDLDETPWTDDYWGLYLGVLGKRYADPEFPDSRDWNENFTYVKRRPAAAIAASGDARAIDRLSPSEKYDLLVGDAHGSLTARMWEEGKSYYDEYGEVETWMGICHGWAPASYMLPRPRKVVETLAADGVTRLRFYPSDIKGLATLLWANADTISRFVGSRSNDKDPQVDDAGRLVSPRNFDTNPGTWHMSVVNQLGACRRSLVMDATFDYEVWNQPLAGYQFSYFNPQTRRYVPDLASAIVPWDSFTRDHFRKYRRPGVASVVGVMMRVRYVVEGAPSHATEDSPARDLVRQVRYLYDLELDGDGKIIGGEWYQNKHPDFLWTPPPDTRARTTGDAYALGSWSIGQPVPEAWRRAAWRVSASPTSPSPLAKIVEALIAAAHD